MPSVLPSTSRASLEYVYFGGMPIAEKDGSGNWTDYIFAGGRRLAKATAQLLRVSSTTMAII
jgi:hypothetical protein